MNKVFGLFAAGIALVSAAAPTAAPAMAGSAEAVVLYDWVRAKQTSLPSGVRHIGDFYEVAFDSRRDGVWSERDGVRRWSFAIRVPGAASVAVEFAFDAVPGAVLSIAGEHLARSQRRYVSDHVVGDVVGFALTAPVAGAVPNVLITSLRVGPTVTAAPKDGGIEDEYTAYACHATPERDLNARASAAICIDGRACCSATLINNTAGESGAPKPYVLTAEHCQPNDAGGSLTEPDLPESAFRLYWNYERPCGEPGVAFTFRRAGAIEQVGGTHVAEWKGLGDGTTSRGDLWVIELSSWPDTEANARLAGFDARDQSPASGSTLYGIHFGAMKPKQFVSSPVWVYQDNHVDPDSVFSLFLNTVAEGSVGDITPGSSGSGLFSEDGLLLGVASGDGPEGTRYQLIGSAWTKYGVGSVLQPANSGEGGRVLPGQDAPQPLPPPQIAISAKPDTINPGDSSVLTWQVTSADRCVASGEWTGERALSGTESVAPGSAGDHVYTLVCDNADRGASGGATVTVRKSNSGGGGSAGLGLLAVLAAGCLLRRRQSAAAGA